MKTPRILPSFLKGINILEQIAANPTGMRLTDVSQKTGLPPSNATLYVNTLVQAGFLVRDPLNRKYYISPFAIDLFRNASEGIVHQLIPHADHPMLALHEEYNENVLLAFKKENNLVFIKHISSGHIMRIGIESTSRIPLHATAAGRAILAFLPEKEVNAYIKKASFEKITSKTVSSEGALRKALGETRENGYAFNSGEFENEVMATAAPIMANDYPVASLVVQFPTLRHSETDANEAAVEIVKQAKTIEDSLKKEI